MRTRGGSAAVVGACALAVACGDYDTDITVGVYSTLAYNTDAQVRGVCIDVESRGLPVQRIVATVSPGVPPRRLFDFRIVPRDDDLSGPITVTIVARTRAGCTLGVEIARSSRVLHFIPGDHTREALVFGNGVIPGVDAGVDVPAPEAGVDVPVTRPDGPDPCGCPSGQTCCGGVCTNTRIDPRNCGGCGSVCGETTFCVGGACVCPMGQLVCDGRRCTDPRFDPDWCGPGTCGGRCGTVANGMRLCQNGRCVYTCNDGFEPFGGMCVRCGQAGDPVCDGAMACAAGLMACDGLCRDILRDRMHCGSCAGVCPGGQSCMNGACR